MRIFPWILLCLLLTACGGQTAEPIATGSTSVAIVRALVTVELPPTLSRAERLATRQAQPVTPTSPPPSATPTETPYIGVFLGEAQNDANVPRISQPTAAPTETPSGGCGVEIDPAFGTAWRQDASVARQIGCALQVRFGFAADVQVFERGVMYRRQDSGEVWAIQPNSLSVGRYWFSASAPQLIPPLLSVPEGLRPPSEVFAPLWISDPALQAALGYGRTPQQTADLNVQRVEGGTLFLDVTIAQVFILLDNGDVYGPF
jgi:hypothetical protein